MDRSRLDENDFHKYHRDDDPHPRRFASENAAEQHVFQALHHVDGRATSSGKPGRRRER